MATAREGYSGTPLARKLGIASGHRVALLGAPAGIEDLLAPLPGDVRLLRRARAPIDVALLFVHDAAALRRRLPAAQAAMTPAGALWVAWPKRASGVPTDVTEDVVRAAGLARGLVDTKVCAVDATWSGLRLVTRLRDRPRRRG
ncbi:MAG TPA: hypothetical protein VNT51_04215 [Miltoncostaeaceae bacterium]|nr:hypothetical protein [Miltoncostaeaceae bacterium]